MSTKETYKTITDVDELWNLMNIANNIQMAELFNVVARRHTYFKHYHNTFQPHPTNKLNTFAKFSSN